MGFRLSFLAGFGVGFVVGARAGRERYEQIKNLASQAKDSPAVQQAAGAAQAQAADLAGKAKDQAAQRVPQLTEKAKSKMPGSLGDRIPSGRGQGGNGQSEPGSTYTGTAGPASSES
jgi:hypothetical protein